MSTSACLLGIDIGGTAAKVAAFDTKGRLLARAETRIPLHTPHPGWAEFEPADWRRAVASGVRRVLDEGGVRPGDVAGVGLSNMIGTVTPLDANGEPLRSAIAYYDTRSAAQVAWLREHVPDVTSITGNRITSGNMTLTSILWLRENEPRVFQQTRHFLQTNSYLFRWLTGETLVDQTNASFVGLYDYHLRDWHAGLAGRCGVDLDRLAPIAPSHTTAQLKHPAARQLGLPAGVPVAIGGLDGAMSSLGVGAVRPGDAFDVSGTSEMIAVCLDRVVVRPELLQRWHVVPDIWVLIGAISTPGAAVQWFNDTLVVPARDTSRGASFLTMLSEASLSPPGANGVTFLPHLMGERAPIWDPHARGVFCGLSLATTRGDMARAVMEGGAFAMRHLIEIIREASGVELRRVVTMGGGTRNRLWLQIKADVWNLELAIARVPEPAALGAALAVGVGAGVYGNYDEAVARAVAEPDTVIRPDPQAHDAYGHPYRVYRRLYPALAETMRYAETRAAQVSLAV